MRFHDGLPAKIVTVLDPDEAERMFRSTARF